MTYFVRRYRKRKWIELTAAGFESDINAIATKAYGNALGRGPTLRRILDRRGVIRYGGHTYATQAGRDQLELKRRTRKAIQGINRIAAAELGEEA